MLQRPKVGDTVILRAIVAEVDENNSYDLMKLNFIDCASPGIFSNNISSNCVHSIIESPLRVGDQVLLPQGGSLPHDLLLIHGDAVGDGHRLWGVIAYKGDIPRSYPLADLKRFS